MKTNALWNSGIIMKKWNIRKDDSGHVNIERLSLNEVGVLEAYELTAYIDLSKNLNPVTGRIVPDKILEKAREFSEK